MESERQSILLHKELHHKVNLQLLAYSNPWAFSQDKGDKPEVCGQTRVFPPQLYQGIQAFSKYMTVAKSWVQGRKDEKMSFKAVWDFNLVFT